jgi:hypothetical protein
MKNLKNHIPSAEIHRNLEEETSNKESKLDMNET